MPNKDNPNSLDKLSQLASNASEKTRRPPLQEVRPVATQQQPPSSKERVSPQKEEELVQLNVRIPRRLIEALDMALVIEKRKQERRVTQRELVEQALEIWLKQEAYKSIKAFK